MAAADLRQSLGWPEGAVSQVEGPLLLRPGLFDSWSDRRDHHVLWREGGSRRVSDGRAGRLGTGDRPAVRFGCRSIAQPARLQPPESEHEGRAFRLKFGGTCCIRSVARGQPSSPCPSPGATLLVWGYRFPRSSTQDGLRSDRALAWCPCS